MTKGRLHLTVLSQQWDGGRPFDCETAPRPCRQTDCRYHLLDGRGEGPRMSDGGRMINPDNRPGRKPKAPVVPVTVESMTQTCSIDVAEDGSKTRVQIGALMGLSRERVLVIERVAMRKFRAARLELLDALKESGSAAWRWRG